MVTRGRCRRLIIYSEFFYDIFRNFQVLNAILLKDIFFIYIFYDVNVLVINVIRSSRTNWRQSVLVLLCRWLTIFRVGARSDDSATRARTFCWRRERLFP